MRQAINTKINTEINRCDDSKVTDNPMQADKQGYQSHGHPYPYHNTQRRKKRLNKHSKRIRHYKKRHAERYRLSNLAC